MADIFISYAREDRDRVAPLARALADRGWSVWWDRQIQPGQTFDEVIEAALAEASAVVCCWTESGVASRWVRTEADEGAARGILVPVMLDPVRISLAFRRIQAADLTDWEPGTEHAGFTELVRALERIAGPPSPVDLDSPGDVTATAVPDPAGPAGDDSTPVALADENAVPPGPSPIAPLPASAGVDGTGVSTTDELAQDSISPDGDTTGRSVLEPAAASDEPDPDTPDMAADAAVAANDGAIAAAEAPSREEPTADEPSAEQPTVEEPTVEEPTVEEPTVEEATVEEPTVAEATVPPATAMAPDAADQPTAAPTPPDPAPVSAPPRESQPAAATAAPARPEPSPADESPRPIDDTSPIGVTAVSGRAGLPAWLEQLPLTPAQLAGVGVGLVVVLVAAIVILSGGGDPAPTTTAGAGATNTTGGPTTAAPATTAAPTTTATTAPPDVAGPIEMVLVPAGAPEIPPPPECADKCATTNSIVLEGNSIIVDWTAEGFEPSTRSFHAHFFWNDIQPAQAGTNAATFGVSRGDWELTDDQPFTSREDMRPSRRPAAADQVCLTVANGSHGVVDPTVFVCDPLPAVFSAWESGFTDANGSTHALATTAAGETMLAYWITTDDGEFELRLHLPPGAESLVAGTNDTSGLIAADVLPDNRPIVAFDASQKVQLAACGDAACTVAPVQEISTAAVDDLDVSVGPDGLPLIVYTDFELGELRVAHCSDPECREHVTHFVGSDSRNEIYDHVVVVHGADGLPAVTYSYEAGAVEFLHCRDAMCAEASRVRIADDAEESPYAAVVIGADDNPRIAYIDANGSVVVVTCHDPACATSTPAILGNDGIDAFSMTLATTGYPLVAGRRASDGATVVGFCGSTDCQAATWVEIDAGSGISLDVLAPPGDVPIVSRASDDGLTLYRLTP